MRKTGGGERTNVYRALSWCMLWDDLVLVSLPLQMRMRVQQRKRTCDSGPIQLELRNGIFT